MRFVTAKLLAGWVVLSGVAGVAAGDETRSPEPAADDAAAAPPARTLPERGAAAVTDGNDDTPTVTATGTGSASVSSDASEAGARALTNGNDDTPADFSGRAGVAGQPTGGGSSGE